MNFLSTAQQSGMGAGVNPHHAVEFHGKVRMMLDEMGGQACPARWIGKVTVSTKSGR